MNLDSITKLCRMIEHTYKIIASYYDSDGALTFMSTELENEDQRSNYLIQTDFLVQKCMKTMDIQICIDDIALTWIGIPVILGEIVRGYIALGPFYANIIPEKAFIDTVSKMNLSAEQKEALLNYHSIITYCPYKEYVKIIKFIHFYLYDQELEESRLGLMSQILPENQNEDMDNVVESSDVMEFHGTYLFERCMLECIRTGNLVNLHQVLQTGTAGKAGTVSVGNELRQEKNMFIVSTTLATRAAIEGGLNSEIALSISDLYIRQIEATKSISEILLKSEKMILDFTSRVHELLRINAYSRYVNQCCDYIQTNIYSNISVKQIAEYLKISQEHLSRLFSQETGMSVTEYIKKIKVKEAKFLLKYSDNSLVEISEKLAFSSQSHFNTVFKDEMGLTPKQYRDKVKIKCN